VRPKDPNTLIAPADADSIITVGAVSSSGTIAYFSSYGPTVDGRIKPDVVAQGMTVRCADPNRDSVYTYANGTSLACPLVAGSAALVLKAHPTAQPMEVIHALKATADNAASPNNRYGWGLIDVVAAIKYLDSPANPEQPAMIHASQYMTIRGASVRYTLPEPSVVTITVYNILGQEVKVLLKNTQTAASSAVTWDATSSSGSPVASGVYVFRLEARGASGAGYSGVGKSMVVH
jgi:subtilisin family serine protease